MILKVAAELLFFDSTMLSLDNYHLRSRSKIWAALGLVRKLNPCKGHGPDHHSLTIVGTNCIITSYVESAGEGVKNSLEKIIRLLNKSMNKPHVPNINPLHLNCSSDRLCDGSDNQKN